MLCRERSATEVQRGQVLLSGDAGVSTTSGIRSPQPLGFHSNSCRDTVDHDRGIQSLIPVARLLNHSD